MPATLTATDLHVGHAGVEVLSGIDLSLEEHAPPLGLIGPSGAGKTTLIDTLRGAIRPRRGRVVFNGRDVTRRRGRGAREFRAAVRFVSQYSLTITERKETVASRLEQAAHVARHAGRTHSLTPAELLESAGLEPHFLPRATLSLSGGERQRLALAAALATRPQILVLDEPLTAIDPHARARIAGTLKETIDRLGMGVLIASQDLELIGRLCPEVVFLAEGRLVEQGPLRDVLRDSTHRAVRELAEYSSGVPPVVRP